MLKICLVFLKSEPQYAYKRYAYKKHVSWTKFPDIFTSCRYVPSMGVMGFVTTDTFSKFNFIGLKKVSKKYFRCLN